MTYPRAHLVDEKNSGYYHCTSRCVRRAWLCGKDPVSGSSYDHRKEWLERKLLRLAKYFAVDLCAYAVMSNHYHVVVRTAPKRAADWSAEEVARRWLSRHGNVTRGDLTRGIAALAARPQRIKELRSRLASLSWFMRDTNEPMARMANAEDDCKGRFWEGRFKSVALLDRNAIINCMVYVELNPARANARQSIPSSHTSALLRTNTKKNPLIPLSDLALTTQDYLKLIYWTHDCSKKHRQNKQPPVSVLAGLGQSEAQWLQNLRAQSEWYRAYGLPDALKRYVRKIEQRWIQMPMLRITEVLAPTQK